MKNRFEALDAFRGICALSVAIFHTRIVGSITELGFFRGSSIFVDFFFVLSGFVLAHGYAYKEKLPFSTFMKSRFLRIYPLHIFMLLVMLTLEIIRLLAHRSNLYTFNVQPFTGLNAIEEVIPNLLLLQSWTHYTKSISFNSPAWSISIEFYMYALFFCSIAAARKNKAATWLITSIAAFVLIHLKSSLLTPEALRGISCFFGGAFTYHMFVQASTYKPNQALGTGIELLLLSMIALVVQSTFEQRSLVASLLFMITVFFFAFEAGAVSQVLKAKPFQLVGKLSYSIYMTHFAILACIGFAAVTLQKVTGMAFTTMIDDLRHLDFGSRTTNNIAALITALIFVGISGITYKYIEVPGQKLNRKRTANAEKHNAGPKTQAS